MLQNVEASIKTSSQHSSFHVHRQLFMAHRLVKCNLAELFAFRTYEILKFREFSNFGGNFQKNVPFDAVLSQ